MHLSNNGTSCVTTTGTCPSYTVEWTMLRHDSNGAWAVDNNGTVRNYGFSWPASVRPVFYISTNNLKLSGAGSLSNPFVIQDVEEN